MRHLWTTALLLLTAVPAAAGVPARFAPDPASVQRYGPAYRYPQAGWIVLHVEGDPYERGYQHGRLLAPEIAGYMRCLAGKLSRKSPEEGWKITRMLVNATFLRGFDEEYLKEMKGIADGASAAGARFDRRPIDLIDIATVNLWAEIETLESAVEATPTGLEGVRFPRPAPKARTASKEDHCSAFAATGPATADGKIVFGHITMFSLYPSGFFNVWLDVKPSKGHRVVMQSYPGGIQSGMDYYLNDAGLIVCETTITQTRFDVKGTPLASRIRKALQYAESIDRAVAILKEGNNGLYTNEWLLADTKTNEIAMFELGTHQSRLRRSSKGEWFGGTEGFYWGCNNTKDLAVRLETIPGANDRPADVVWRPSDRDQTWLKLYAKHKGKIDANFGKEAFATPPLAAYPSLDAKVTTTALAKDLQSWALFGPPLGRTWKPTHEQQSDFPEIRPLVSNPWTVLHAGPPTGTAPSGLEVVDLPPRDKFLNLGRDGDESPTPTVAAWHGTLLPKTDADVWLAAAFAQYEKYVALENALRERADDGKLSPSDRDRLGVKLYAARSQYLTAARVVGDVPLAKTKADVKSDGWYDVAAGKGVLLLHSLREIMGRARFEEAMDEFGRSNAGKEVATTAFVAHMEKASGKKLGKFFADWWEGPGLPTSASPDGRTAGTFSVRSFQRELDQALIVYGTTDEAAANRETAKLLQQAIRAERSNVTVPVKADSAVTDADLKGRHLLLVGRPATNRVVERFRAGLPIPFGSASFAVRGETYAHMGSAVIVAGENPLNERYSLVVLAGLSADATYHTPAALLKKGQVAAEVLVLPHRGKARALVLPARELGW